MKPYGMILRVGVVVLVIRLGLRIRTLPQVLGQLAPRVTTKLPDAAAIQQLAYYVDRWLRLFPYNRKGNCFPRALALYHFARQQGYPVRFHCGVRKDVVGLDGHAWLTLEGQPFYEPGSLWCTFTVTYAFPPDIEQTRGHGSPDWHQDMNTMAS